MSRTRNTGPLDCKVYIGDLGNNGDRSEIEHAFGRFGPLKNVWVARNPPGFAFAEFEDPRDAEDAARDMDGRNVCGRRVRVELSNGRSKSKRGFGDGGREGGRESRDGGRDGGRGGGSYGSRDGRDRGGRNDDRPPPRRRSRSRSPRAERRRSKSPQERNGGEAKMERMESGSPPPAREKNGRRAARADSEDKNGSPGSKD